MNTEIAPAGQPEQEAKPRRRARKPKATAADESPKVTTEEPEFAAVKPEDGKPAGEKTVDREPTSPMGAHEVPAAAAEPAPPAPRRRTRKPKAAVEEVQADVSDDAAASPEVMQARALAQVSQASVVRRQRRAAARAAEVLSAQDAPAAEPAVSEAPADGGATASVSPDQAPSPLVDPSLRPHRRGRKPKAYVEAEKAAAAALVAQQASLMEEREQAQRAADEPGRGDAAQQAVEAPSRDADAPEHQAADAAAGAVEPHTPAGPEAPADPKRSVRPGRGSRTRKAAEEAVPAADPERAVTGAADPADAAKSGGKQARRSHQARRDGERGDRAERGDKPSSKADARRERRERQKENRKQRNNRFAPAEPTLTRGELSAMKVAELREKARELELDPTGIKKPELIEVVYAAAAKAEGFRDVEGILDMDNQGFGYIRVHGYMPSRDDAFVPAQLIRAAGLRPGDLVAGTLRPMRANDKLPGLAKLRSINGLDPEEVKHRPKFSDLTPVYPNEPLRMEHGKDSITGRAIDIVSPIGKGQRGLIVSPPKAGKTTILKKICQSIAVNNPEVHLICLLVDERPEEVTDMQRSIKGEVVASTFDMPADNHTRVSELVIERAKRIVELGGDVVVVLDSITRLARAYNLAAPASGRILSGGVDSAALYPPKRFLGAARNIENGGSLTILASALVDTGSKMDEVIFEEFKGTGNMELKLDRDLADRRIFPAIDPVASGTRNEDLLVDEQMRPFVWGIRRILAGMNNTERAAASFIKGLKGTNSNQDFLIRTAKKAADHPEAL